MAEKKKSASRSQTADLKTRGSEKEQPAKSARVATSEESQKPKAESSKPKAESKKVESKPAARRENRSSSPSLMARIRSNRIGRFILEAYYELRHKVTWPTFEEARNMTIAVIIISVVIGAIIAAVDFGLYQLFLLIIGGGK